MCTYTLLSCCCVYKSTRRPVHIGRHLPCIVIRHFHQSRLGRHVPHPGKFPHRYSARLAMPQAAYDQNLHTPRA
jgi:hypothetical protein